MLSNTNNKNNLHKHKTIILFLATFIVIFANITVFANSAQRPSIIFVVDDPTKEVILSYNGMVTSIEYILGEKFYVLYFVPISSYDKDYIEVKSEDTSFQVCLEQEKKYHQIYTIDLDNKTIVEGKLPLYVFIRDMSRLLITLILEGFLFWLFGFKKKKSWKIFLITNVITQTLLGVGLNNIYPFDFYSLFAWLFFLEILILISESIVFAKFIEESGKGKAVLFAFVANFVSLTLGSYLLMMFF